MHEYRAATINRLLSSPKFPELATKLLTLQEMSAIWNNNPQKFEGILGSLCQRQRSAGRPGSAAAARCVLWHSERELLPLCCMTPIPCRNKSPKRSSTAIESATPCPSLPSPGPTGHHPQIRPAYSLPPHRPGSWPWRWFSLVGANCAIEYILVPGQRRERQ